MGERIQYEPEFGWACAWSNGNPRPFILVGIVASTRKQAMEKFTDWYRRNDEEPRSKAWRRAYRDGARCIRVSIAPWGCAATRPAADTEGDGRDEP